MACFVCFYSLVHALPLTSGRFSMLSAGVQVDHVKLLVRRTIDGAQAALVDFHDETTAMSALTVPVRLRDRPVRAPSRRQSEASGQRR